jgi:hypothetical protein
MSENLISEYETARDQNFTEIIDGLTDLDSELESGFVNTHNLY